jgi:GMP synthase-like glutamine amidotransferase
MRAHCFQHVSFEGLGSIEPWLKSAGYSVCYTRFFESAVLPQVDKIDFLIVMGGPMSVNDELEFPWLSPEKAFIRSAVEARKPVLGICLGAQLISSALGAAVYRNACKEIGWFPVQAVPPTGEPPFRVFRFPPETEVFHWHGETFDLPTGAVHLASSAGCRNQAFQLGPSTIGLQFHLETTPESLRLICENCRAELVGASYVQTEAALLASAPEKYSTINRLMAEVLEFLKASHGTS